MTPDLSRASSTGAMLTAVADTDVETRESDRNALPPFGILGEVFHCVDCVGGPLVRLKSMVHHFHTTSQALDKNIVTLLNNVRTPRSR